MATSVYPRSHKKDLFTLTSQNLFLPDFGFDFVISIAADMLSRDGRDDDLGVPVGVEGAPFEDWLR